MGKRQILISFYSGCSAHLYTSRKEDGFIGVIHYDNRDTKEFLKENYTEHTLWLNGVVVANIQAEGGVYGSHFPKGR